MTEDQLEEVAKGWYNEQRGRLVGNTRSWDDLSAEAKVDILNVVNRLLYKILSHAHIKVSQ